MKATKGIAPPLREDGPEKNGSAGEDESRWALGESGEAEEETEEEGGKGG